MSNIKNFTNEEIVVILETISNARYVSPSFQFVNLLKNKEGLLNELLDELLMYKDDKIIYINKKYFPLIKDVLEFSLKTYPEDEIQTYTGQTKYFIEELINKLNSGLI